MPRGNESKLINETETFRPVPNLAQWRSSLLCQDSPRLASSLETGSQTFEDVYPLLYSSASESRQRKTAVFNPSYFPRLETA